MEAGLSPFGKHSKNEAKTNLSRSVSEARSAELSANGYKEHARKTAADFERRAKRWKAGSTACVTLPVKKKKRND